MSERRSFTVVGLGIFGSSVAKTFVRSGMDVVAIDRNMMAVEYIADTIKNAVRADATDIEQLKEAGVQNTDVAIVAMGNHLEESILTILNLKELGIKEIIVKASNKEQRYVFERIGATKVLQPEKEMGMKTAMTIMAPNIRDMIRLDDKYAVVEIETPALWQNHSIAELNLRKNYGVNVIGIRRSEDASMEMLVDVAQPLSATDILVMIVDRKEFGKLKL